MINTPKEIGYIEKKSHLLQSVQGHINSVVDSKGYRYIDNSAETLTLYHTIPTFNDPEREGF